MRITHLDKAVERVSIMLMAACRHNHSISWSLQ